jgi:glycosyltransferase involved in cell wall biosynthesis
MNGVSVRYLRPAEQNIATVEALLRSSAYQLVHLNSVVSLPFSAYPLFVNRFHGIPLLISPHGELSANALAKKEIRKKLYLRTAKIGGFFRNVNWHAASPEEAEDLARVWGASADITIAPLFPPRYTVVETTAPTKVQGTLRIIFLARIDRMKNLDFAIEMVGSMTGATLDIYGPISQLDYWEECRALIAASPRSEAFAYRGSIPSSRVIATLSKYDLLLQPSQSENFGYTILESLVAGCPVLISDRTPWRELQTAQVGFDLPLEDPNGFRRALTYMRDLSGAEHFHWRERARSYASTYIHESPAKAATRAMYKALLEKA